MESKIQRKIIKDLEANGWIVIKTIVLSKSGYPDIIAFKNSKTIFIEVKDTKGVVSELQAYRIRQLKAQGFNVFLIYSYIEYINVRDADFR